MKKTLVLLIGLFISLNTTHSQAEIKLPNFQLLCSYDSSCKKVGKVVKRQLVLRNPSPVWVEYYKRLRPNIIAIAKLYDIDPVTLVLTPLAENTMNVNGIDKIQNELAMSGLADEGSFMGREMSIGPGQIYVSAAKKVEDLAARIEARPKRTKSEIKDQLLTPGGALRYAAAIIRSAQDIYAEAGFDISKRPEILATLYNIGKVELRLRDTISLKREPYPNYFGYFVGANYKRVQEELNLPSALDTEK